MRVSCSPNELLLAFIDLALAIFNQNKSSSSAALRLCSTVRTLAIASGAFALPCKYYSTTIDLFAIKILLRRSCCLSVTFACTTYQIYRNFAATCRIMHRTPITTLHIYSAISNGCTQVCSLFEIIYYREMEKSTLKSHQDPMHFNKKSRLNETVKCTLDYIYTNKMQKVSLFIFILLGAPRNVESICNKRFTKFNLLTECVHTVSRYFHSNSFIRISSLALLYLPFAFAPAERWTWEYL